MADSPNDALCPLCQGDNQCGNRLPLAGSTSCWCMNEEIPKAAIEAVDPELKGRSCICQSCARRYQKGSKGGDIQQDSSTPNSGVHIANPSVDHHNR